MRQQLRDLVRPRYAALTALMVVVALICVVAGTWQILRYDGKHLANDDLRGNARDTVAPVAAVLPLVGTGPAPDADAVEFRSVTATGRYDATDQLLVRRQQVDDANGYTVLTPLRTDTGAVLLVVRGFVASASVSLSPAAVAAPPAGDVTLTGRVQPTDSGDDRFRALDNGQVERVNAAAAAQRLGTDVYAGYVELEAGQPGTAGLTAIPAPDLSNPAGGAFEWQHLAYVVQWYLFAALALAGPFVMVRVDRKREREDAAAVVAHLELGSPARVGPAAIARADGTGAALVRVDGEDRVRERDVRAHEEHVRSASERLAERYGRR